MNHPDPLVYIPATDGFELAATIYEPIKDKNHSVIVINSATAVPRQFYKIYARHLSRTGYTVITYDYRGIGGSRPKSLKGFGARMRDWAELDMTGVIEWANAQYQPQHLFVIGHSIGGQGMGLLNNHNKVAAMVTLSAQSGYWALQPGAEKYRVALFMYFVFPLLANTFGYFPWSRMASGEDLPKGVALEWARWCRLPDYFLGDPTLDSAQNFAHFSAPILAYSFSDDVWGSERSVNAMMANYMGASVERRHKTPQQARMQRIGHVGFFLPKARALWQEVDEWLCRQGAAPCG